MGLLGDDEHPDPSATALHKILDFFLFLIGVACIIFSAYYMNILKASSFFAIIIMEVGIGLIVIAIVGMFGSGYYKGNDKEGRLICLRIFWLAALIFTVVLFMFGGICLFSQETIQSYVLVYYGQFTDMTNQFGGQAGSVIQQLTALMNNFQVLGGVAVGVGVYLLLCFGCSSYIMGTRIFLLTVAMFGSIGIAAVGVVVIILSAYFQLYTEVMSHVSKILYGGIVLGIISIICGIVGLVAYWLHKRLPIVIQTYTMVVVALAIAYYVVGIISFSLSNNLNASLREKVDEICGKGVITSINQIFADNSPCYELVVNSITYECTRVRNAEMSADICPFPRITDPANPVEPNCLCAGSSHDYIKGLGNRSDYLKFAYLSNKKSVISNYKILGMLGLVTGGLLTFIAVTLLISCLCYTPKKLSEEDDDEFEWVYEDENESEDSSDEDDEDTNKT